MLWVKAFHIIFVICWFAGIFYLPRLFVYHAMARDQATRDHLKIMERKLYVFMTPFALLSIVLVLLVVIYHLACGQFVKQLAKDNMRSHVFYRWFNEVPILAMFPIVILVVVKPF